MQHVEIGVLPPQLLVVEGIWGRHNLAADARVALYLELSIPRFVLQASKPASFKRCRFFRRRVPRVSAAFLLSGAQLV